MKNKCLLGTKHFLAVTSDNRLRLWDTVSNKEKYSYVEKQHLAHSYTCFAWGQDLVNKGPDDLGMCAVGTSDGLIVVWDMTRGVVVRTIGSPGGTPPPTDIKFSHDLKTIFACNSSSSVFEYYVDTGEEKNVIKGFKKGANCLAVHQDVLAIGSGTVKLFNCISGKKEKLDVTFSSGGVSVLTFSDCGNYLACSGARAREIALFDLRSIFNTKKEDESKKISPLCVCPVSGVPQQLSVRAHTCQEMSGWNAFDIICVLEGQGGCLIRAEIKNNNKNEAAPPKLTHVPIEGLDSIKKGALAVRFSAPLGEIRLATGPLLTPRFFNVQYIDKTNDSLQSAITIPTMSKSNGKDERVSENSSDGIHHEVSILGPHENGGTKRPLIENDDESPGKRIKVDAIDKLTVEERLNNAAHALLNSESDGTRAATDNNTMANVPTTDSLVALVEQSLQAGDDGLLEQCLDCPDKDVVEETSKRLPTPLVVQLLRKLVAKFEKKPTRGVLLTRWIHSLLRYHMSFLLSVPDLSQQMAALSQMLEQRLGTYSRLASLAGRLDLLISQISSVSAPSSSTSIHQQETLKTPNETYYVD